MLPEPSTATLSRFILESSRISGGRANYRAFLPPPDLQLSTFNVDNLTADGIWKIGDTIRLQQRKHELHGRADLLAEAVYALNLRPLRDDHPPRHVVIVDWPTDKAHQRNKAQLLAAASDFVPRGVAQL
jgi:hypothetical protein